MRFETIQIPFCSVIYSVTSNSGPTMLSAVMDTTVTTSAARRWSIRVLQYECSSRNLGVEREKFLFFIYY